MDCCAGQASDHLFLLVGNNPLPNLVAGSLLTKPTSILHLLHTENTFQYAVNIKQLIVQRLSISASQIKLFPLRLQTDQASIFQDLNSYFDLDASLKTGSIGLNYTGGMKPMAVHVYEFLKNHTGQTHQKFIHSYLDPIHYAMRFSHAVTHKISYSELQISLAELLSLHTKQISSSKKDDLFPSYCNQLAHFASTPKNMKNLRSWCDHHIRTLKNKDLDTYIQTLYRDNSFVQSKFPNLNAILAELKDRIDLFGKRTLPIKPISEQEKNDSIDFVAQMGLALLETKEIPKDEVHQWQPKTIADTLIKFLDGGWLENYVIACLHEISKKCNLYDVQKNMFVKSADPATTITGFEFDVAAMQGYRLYAFSCTTGMQRSMVKGKLMEAFTRAKQMGGDESRVALVCGYLQPDNLLEEINESWMTSRDKIRIFGPQDFEMLLHKLESWFSL